MFGLFGMGTQYVGPRLKECLLVIAGLLVGLLVGCDGPASTLRQPSSPYTSEGIEAHRRWHWSKVHVDFFVGPYEGLRLLFEMPDDKLSTAEALMPREIVGPNGYRYILKRIYDTGKMPGDSEATPGRRMAMYRHDCGDAPCSCGWEEP